MAPSKSDVLETPWKGVLGRAKSILGALLEETFTNLIVVVACAVIGTVIGVIAAPFISLSFIASTLAGTAIGLTIGVGIAFGVLDHC